MICFPPVLTRPVHRRCELGKVHFLKLQCFSFFSGIVGILAVLPLLAFHPQSESVTLLTWPGHRMFEDFSARSEVSPDGKWVLRTFVDGNETLLRLPTGNSDAATLQGGLHDFERAAWCGTQLLRLGTEAGKRAWFAQGPSGFIPLSIPPEATPVCSAAGDHLAYFTSFPARRELPPPKDIYIGTQSPQAREDRLDIGGVVLTAKFSPDANMLYVLSRQESGSSTLSSITLNTMQVKQLARDLDAWPFPGPELAVTSDGKSLILPLATLKAPDDARRQVPRTTERWLKLYRFDIATRQFSLLAAEADSDQTDPSVVGNDLYYVSSHNTKNVVASPSAGGPVHTVVAEREAYLPTWSRDGKRIAFVEGEYRLADWALSQDVGVVAINDEIIRVGDPKPFVVGNHEDFPVEWSPDGRWIAWHSHRDPHRNAPYYDEPGATDDIWVRRAEDLHAPEIKVTRDLWETGWAYWSPDGSELIYTTWDRNGQPGVYQVRVTKIDTSTGQPLEEHRFPMPKQVVSPEIAEWSPSGAEIAVEDAVSPTERILWIVSKDGSRLQKVLSYTSETYGGFDWSPDGQTLYFSALEGDNMKIFSVARTGGPSKKISDGPGNYLNPSVSPNGRWIASSELETIQNLRRQPLP
jgi:WD40 repeat protein